MLACWESHLLCLVLAFIPSRVWEHRNKVDFKENKKICKPPLPRIHGALLRKNIWSSDILEKKHSKR